MISEVDEALRTLIRAEIAGGPDVEVVLDAPTKDWAARRNAPTVNVYLYDIREDLRRRERGWVDVIDGGHVNSRRPSPRFFKLSYLVTAWTQRAEDEHRLLSSLLRSFLRYEALPTHLVVGPLAETGLRVPITVGLPPPEDRAFADVWSALGGELKPSLDVVVVAPVELGYEFPAGALVREGPVLDLWDVLDIDQARARRPSEAASPGGGSRGAAGGARGRAATRRAGLPPDEADGPSGAEGSAAEAATGGSPASGSPPGRRRRKSRAGLDRTGKSPS